VRCLLSEALVTTKKPVILIVDDNGPLLRATSRMLKHHGYDVREAFGLASALSAAGAQRIDGALINFEMPDATGVEVIEQLRAIDSRLAARALIHTGIQPDEPRWEALVAAGHVLVSKSADVDEKLDAIQKRFREVP